MSTTEARQLLKTMMEKLYAIAAPRCALTMWVVLPANNHTGHTLD